MLSTLCVIRALKINPNRLRTATVLVALGSSGALVSHAATLCVNRGGTSGCKSTITAAVNAASPGDTILIARGTYKEDIVITQSVSLIGSDRGTVIDATGLSNGIFINAPQLHRASVSRM